MDAKAAHLHPRGCNSDISPSGDPLVRTPSLWLRFVITRNLIDLFHGHPARDVPHLLADVVAPRAAAKASSWALI